MTYTGRCYCGASSIRAMNPPLKVVYCHCHDCRRLTGAPVAAFAGFAEDAVCVSGDSSICERDHARREFCAGCGTQLTARFSYLAGQVYVPLGCFDQIVQMPPEAHCHSSSAVPWLNVADDLPRMKDSASGFLLTSKQND